MKQKLFPVLVMLLTLFLASSCHYEEHPTWTTPELNTSDMILKVGETAVRTGVSKVPGRSLVYYSSNPSVATVDQNGLITAINVGETTITVNMPYPEQPTYVTSASFKVKVVAVDAATLNSIDKSTPLTLVAVEDGYITVAFNGGVTLANDIYYTINGGAEQTISKSTVGEVQIDVSKGDFIQFWSTNTALSSGPGGGSATSRAKTRAVDTSAKYINIKPSMKTEIFGNVMSLLKGKDNLESATTIEANNAFYGLFAGADKLVNNTERLLVLPATTLTEGCYQDMFNGCKGIEKAPELPAPKLEKNCYQEMFFDCAKLDHVKCLATDISAENSTKDWLGNAGTEATGTKTLETLVEMTPNSDDGVPTSWTATKAVAKVELSHGNLYLVAGESATLTVTVSPDDATDKSVIWTTSNPAVATVSNQGEVTAVAAGEAIITVSTPDGSIQASCKVTVLSNAESASISFEKNQVSVELTEGSYTQEVTNNGDGTVTYTISDNTCGATIDAATGTVSFTQKGSVTVTATVNNTTKYVYSKNTDSYTLTVTASSGTGGLTPMGNPTDL